MRIQVSLLVLLCLFSLSGCSWLLGDDGYFRDRSDDYRKAREEPKLKVPQGLDDTALEDIYVIPPVTEQVGMAGDFEVPRPAPLVAGRADELVRIQKLGEQQWVLVNVSPGQLWPQVRGFLSNSQLPVGQVEPRAGLIETGWLASTEGGMNERYRFRIEQGVQRETSELHVLQMYQAGDITNWPEVSGDLDREYTMLTTMAQYIADRVESAPVSMMAQQSLSASGRVSMQEDPEGQAYIRLELPYDRAWASMARALRESSFEITDSNRDKGEYLVRYASAEGEDGGSWFGWLFGSDDDDSDTAAYLTDKDFVVTLADLSENVCFITIGRQDGVALEAVQSQSILSLVKSNIN